MQEFYHNSRGRITTEEEEKREQLKIDQQIRIWKNLSRMFQAISFLLIFYLICIDSHNPLFIKILFATTILNVLANIYFAIKANF